MLSAPAPSRADDVAEASALFASGNEHFQRAMRLRGARRQRELEAALEQYFASLQRVRSRNVLYNTALVLEALDRAPEAYNHWTEYLAIQGLTEAELADGRQHREALRPRVAAFEVQADADAEVWIDRRDLGSRGRTPLEIALAPGEHTFFLAAAGRREAQASATAALGETARVSVTFELLPVWLQVLAPEGSILEIDGGRVTPGQSVPIQPGPHLARVSAGDRLLAERRFEVMPGSAPMVIDMTSALGAGGLGGGLVTVVVDTAARIEIDGVVQGEGSSVESTLSPGPHLVRVTASGRSAYEGSPDFQLFPARLEVSLAEGASGGILAGRGIFGGLAVAGIITSTVFTALAANMHDQNQSAPTVDNAASLESLTLAVDLSWSATALMGGLAILFLALDAGGGDSTATFSVSPTPGGATLSLRGSLGGAL
ncbi:MAG: hypothetical protein K1X94_31900 [Sandaracinaceae bacterium]|nr:hypothetical protein [Sandaracinaceae bacterium]